MAATVTDPRESRCRWCSLPRFGDHACVCDSPEFVLMEQCADCGTWREVDHVHAEYEDGTERVVCTGRCLA